MSKLDFRIAVETLLGFFPGTQLQFTGGGKDYTVRSRQRVNASSIQGASWVWVIRTGQTRADVRPWRIAEFREFVAGMFDRGDSYEELERMLHSHDVPKVGIQDRNGIAVAIPNHLLPRKERDRRVMLRRIDETVGINELPNVTSGDEVAILTRRFDRMIGRTARVEVGPNDDVVYGVIGKGGYDAARGVRLPLYGKFAVSGLEPLSRHFTVITAHKGGEWRVIAAYVGEPAPPFPGDRNGDYQESLDFWKDHALVLGTIPHRLETETSVCPW